MISDRELAELGLVRLPPEVEALLVTLSAPERLAAHLTLVHDVACRIVDALAGAFPGLVLPREEILFGAATHDIGKAVVRVELVEAGHAHEELGRELLRSAGVSERLSRFSVTHADLGRPEADLGDALVALADKCWKGKRDAEVEKSVGKYLVSELGLSEWEIFDRLDFIVGEIAEGADRRLEWQGRFLP